jgi:hypothetical protein
MRSYRSDNNDDNNELTFKKAQNLKYSVRSVKGKVRNGQFAHSSIFLKKHTHTTHCLLIERDVFSLESNFNPFRRVFQFVNFFKCISLHINSKIWLLNLHCLQRPSTLITPSAFLVLPFLS